MFRIFKRLPAFLIITIIILNLYRNTVSIPDLAELDKPFTRYVSHFQTFASLPHYHNNYLKFISQYRIYTGLG
jgi:hypothetical protein